MRFALASVVVSIMGAFLVLSLTFLPTASSEKTASSTHSASGSGSNPSGAGNAGGSGHKNSPQPDSAPAAGAAAGQNTAPAEKAEFIGTDACLSCHVDYKQWLTQPHGRFLMEPSRTVPGQGCEECHGPGSLHAQNPPKFIFNPDKAKARVSNNLCLKCHNTQIDQHDWQIGAHALANIRCTDCHKVHMNADNLEMLPKPKNQLCFQCHRTIENQLHQNSHHPVLEGKIDCSDCHNIHSGRFDNMLVADEKTTCTRCHADVRGPFVFEHDVTVNGYSKPCTSCHLPHGSPNLRLEKAAGRGECLQCHTTLVINHFPGNCITCHTRLHGSDADPDFLR
ncbi:MAG TPA: cytochrome c3 family protein [Armatimonadota bacterium]|nr:cytochrome c3 family protein [Armatimonadota bacterium]